MPIILKCSFLCVVDRAQFRRCITEKKISLRYVFSFFFFLGFVCTLAEVLLNCFTLAPATKKVYQQSLEALEVLLFQRENIC